jgi:hypothetical protein
MTDSYIFRFGGADNLGGSKRVQGAFVSSHNKSLRSSLMVTLDLEMTEVCTSAFHTDIAAMLQKNASLESLSLRNDRNRIIIKAEEYIALITVLQHNTTLKMLSLFYRAGDLRLTEEEDKEMAALLKKNYVLERLPDIGGVGDVGAILRLNEGGRRYLIEDEFSISKGVEVLNNVNNNMNCVFLHLLENPRLCDRSAVEIR